MPVSQGEIRQSYRTLYKSLLHAVQYSKPARYVLRDRLREAFRTSPVETFDAARISRTLEFINGARKSKGMEHKILKNLVHVWWDRKSLRRRAVVRDGQHDGREKINAAIDKTVQMLNESMGLCIK